MRLDEAQIHLQRLFSHLNLPPTGVTKAWMKTVEEVQDFTTALMEEHGMAGAKLIEEHMCILKPTGKGAWAIRGVLADLSRTIGGIERDLRAIGHEEHNTCFENCERRIGLYFWRSSMSYAHWDDACYRITGVPITLAATRDLYLSLFIHDHEKERMMEKSLKNERGEITGYEDSHLIRRMNDGIIRKIHLRTNRQACPKTGDVISSGYIRDITNPCVMLQPDEMRVCQSMINMPTPSSTYSIQ